MVAAEKRNPKIWKHTLKYSRFSSHLSTANLKFPLITVSMIYFFEGDFFLLLMKFQFHAEISTSWALSSVTIKLILQYKCLSDM